jgi:Tol biopolymer transport system component
VKKLVAFLLVSLIAVFETASGCFSETYITTKLTNNAFDDVDPQINARGDVVWYGHDGKDSEIFLFESSTGTITRLTDNASDYSYLQISANGDVVWQGFGGADYEIFLFDSSAGTTIQP